MNDLKPYDKQYEFPSFGFYNRGATCYFNSLLQALLCCTSLTKVMNQYKNNSDIKKNTVVKKYIEILDMAGQYQSDTKNLKLMNKLNHSAGELWELLIEHPLVKNRDDALSRGQEDASEGFMMLMNVFNPETKFSDYQLPEVDKAFRHRYSQHIYCNDCNQFVMEKEDEYTIFEIEPFQLLERQSRGDGGYFFYEKNSLNQLLLRQTGVIEDYRCPKCQSKKDKNKITRLVMVPEILAVLNKVYDRNTMGKLNIVTPFPKTLEFNGKESEGKMTKFKFEAVAQIEHSGSMRGGHYWARCKKKDGWKLLNDSSVQDSEFKPTSNTYMVFYHLIH